MRLMKKMLVAVVMLSAATGCATKTYGRQGTLTSFERESMTCREIDLETAKVKGFIEHVHKESNFSGRDVLAFLGDFGIGNNLEKQAAIESADKRLEQLSAIRKEKSCTSAPQ